MADPQRPRSDVGYRSMMGFASFIIVVAGLRVSGEIALPFLVAGFIALLVAPPVQWLHKRGVPAWLGVIAMMLGVVVALMIFGAILAASITEFSEAMPRYRDRLGEMVVEAEAMAVRYGLPVQGEGLQSAMDQVAPGAVIDWVGAMLNGLLAAATSTAMVLVTLIFMLLEAAGLPRKIRAAMHDPDADLGRFDQIAAKVQSYLWMKTIVSAMTGGLIYVVVLMMGVDFPVLWGLIGFLLNYIPTIGSILAAVPACLVALVQLGFWPALGLLLAYVAINQIVGNLLEPQLMGRSMGLSPLVVFASLVFWGWIWGPVGMLLSVPLTMVVKIMLEQSDDLEWLAIMLGPTPPPRDESAIGAAASGFFKRITVMKDVGSDSVNGDSDGD